ncbi:hypothetical protein CDD80_967 [Ophiocordyceps camponoti-rufipedis]|uniref:Dihydrofolate reductase n=1 Tax=Ophiocordyceps camponoti-rufipedis TaxID=2004952 RepID=A0A2C5ZB11_9HYPO|nr:hypothetical protein CDD80_967 [Ophiocordyceps camponoti-rufipedis]
MQPPELTLIVAATRSMGIGAQGSLPWTGLRKELQYFARVTSRLPPQVGPRSPPSSSIHASHTYEMRQPPPGAINAVIMGRNTWDSIPPKFRPLKNRLNIVLTRSAPPLDDGNFPPDPLQPVRVSSFDDALRCAARHSPRVFVIGGAQVYDAAWRCSSARRVLLTLIERDFDCDTFFPITLPGAPGWVRKSSDELRRWTGEDTESVDHEENGIKYEFQMWEASE